MPSELDNIEAVVTDGDKEGVLDLVPDNRIETYEEASREYERALLPHIEKARVWGRIDKLFSGVPPFNPCALKELGQTHVVNTDFGDARAMLQKAITSYYNIFYKNKFLAEINIDFTEDLLNQFSPEDASNFNPQTLVQWSNTITEAWTYSKRITWKNEFFDFVAAHLRQVMLYGINHIFFPDKEDIRPESGTIYAHYSPLDSWSNPSKNDIHIVKHEFTVFELLKYYVDDKTKFWNKSALETILMEVLPDMDLSDEEEDTDQISYIERMVRRVRQHEGISNDFYNTVIEVASMYVKEFEVGEKSEGITHIIFTPHITTDGPLFFHDRAYKDMSDVIVISTLLPGFEKSDDAKGLGHISYGHLLELTKMKCNFATNIKLSGTTFFKAESSSVGDIRKITIPVSGISVLPETVKLEHANMNLSAQNILAGVQYLENDLGKNSLFVLNPASSDDAPVGAIQQRAKEAVEMQQNNIAHYMQNTLDQVYNAIFRKELKNRKKQNRGGKLADRFISQCIDKGVPKEVFNFKNIDELTGLPSWFRLNVYKGTGTGSQIGDSLKIQEAYTLGIPQKLKTRGAQFFRELEAAAIFGQEMVEKLYPAQDLEDEPTTMATLASTVANQLEEGKVVQFSPDLDHEVFSSILLERMQQVADTYLQQPPTGITEFKQQERDFLFKTDVALQALGSFLALHLTYLGEDPGKRALYNNIMPLFSRLEGLAQGIHANAEKARDAQAREKAEEAQTQNAQMQEVIFDNERKKLADQNEHVREMFKAKGSFDIKLVQAQQEGNIKRIRATADAQSNIIKAQGEASAKAKQKNLDNTAA